MMDRISVIVVDALPVVRYGIRNYLNTQPQICMTLETDSVLESLSEARLHKADVVIVDLSLLSRSDDSIVHAFTRDLEVALLAYTMNDSWNVVEWFLAAGGRGVVSKLAPVVELTQAIHLIYEGKNYISPCLRLAENPCSGSSQKTCAELSEREMEIAVLVSKGYTNTQISSRLCVSRRTVETHRHKIMRKLQLENRAQLVDFIEALDLHH